MIYILNNKNLILNKFASYNITFILQIWNIFNKSIFVFFHILCIHITHQVGNYNVQADDQEDNYQTKQCETKVNKITNGFIFS